MPEKRMISPRDIGSKIYPSVFSSTLVLDYNVTLTFNTGERPTGAGSLENGSIDIGIGRANKYNDEKGLPEGVQDLYNPWHL